MTREHWGPGVYVLLVCVYAWVVVLLRLCLSPLGRSKQLWDRIIETMKFLCRAMTSQGLVRKTQGTLGALSKEPNKRT